MEKTEVSREKKIVNLGLAEYRICLQRIRT